MEAISLIKSKPTISLMHVTDVVLPILYTNVFHSCYYTRRLVHAFTSAGMLPQQYIKLSKFAEMGVNGKWYIDKGN